MLKLKVYDYANTTKEYNLDCKIEDILVISVSIISGDETGMIILKDGDILEFDACEGHRYVGYDDGGYTLRGEQIKKWLDYNPEEDEGGTISYNRQMFVYRGFEYAPEEDEED